MVQIHLLTTTGPQEIIGAATSISITTRHTRITAFTTDVPLPDGVDYGHIKTVENAAGTIITISSLQVFIGGGLTTTIAMGTTAQFTWIDDGATFGWQVEMEPAQPSHLDLTNIGTNTHAQIDTHVGSTSNPHSVTKAQVSLGDVENLKVNLASAVNPTVDNDTTEGYVVGSRWFNTTGDREYVCLDNTDGAAVWIQTTLIGAGSGDVVGPGPTVTNNRLVLFDGTGGLTIKESTFITDAAGVLSGITQLNVDNLRLDGNIISSTNTNGSINIQPDGTGAVNIGIVAAARIITIGNITTTTSIDINAGPTGTITLNEISIDNNEDVTGMHNVTLDPGGVLALQGATSGTITIDTLAVAGTWTLTLPPDAGTVDYLLRTDGIGNATWITPPLPPGYLDGGNVQWNSVTQVAIIATSCRDSTDSFNLVLSGTTTITITTSGVGGLQTSSSEAADTWYQCFIIGDTTGVNATTTLLVPQGVAFSQTGYDVFRRMGHVRNNGVSNFNRFVMHNVTRSKHVTMEETRTLMTMFFGFTAVANTLETLNIGAFVPNGTSRIDMQYRFDMDAASHKLFITSGLNNLTVPGEIIQNLGLGVTTAAGEELNSIVYNLATDPSGPSFDWTTSVTGNETTFVLNAYIQNI